MLCHLVRKLSTTIIVLVMIISTIPSISAIADANNEYSIAGLPDGSAMITGYSGKAGTLTVPAMIGGMQVTKINDNAFRYVSSIKDVIIPEGVTYIGAGAFQMCRSLMNVTLPATLTDIGATAFDACPKLSSFNVAQGSAFTVIDGSLYNSSTKTLYRCPTMQKGKEYTIPAQTLSIASGAFTGCKFSQIGIPEGIKDIGDGAFASCANLQTVAIPASVTHIGVATFVNCSKLTAIDVSAENQAYMQTDGVLFSKTSKILYSYPQGKKGNSYNIPEGTSDVLDSAFYASKPTSILIPSSMASIGKQAFVGSKIKSIVIPKTVQAIGEGAFLVCDSLTDVTFEGKMDTLGKLVFCGCKKLKSIQLPEGITVLDDNLLAQCVSLSEVILPSSLTKIGQGVFSNCKRLKKMIIPQNVTTIAADAFNTGITLQGSTAYAQEFALSHGLGFETVESK